ncbi:MAG: right-handed parallel beta-helix repeat-containing protein [Clostridiales bacterium]|nr:right-handed parallel beta-helix repeat-containing protein [Clostridiales bacterium]
MKISDLSVQQKKTVLIIIGIGVVLLTALIVAAMLMIGGTDVKPAGGSNTILQDSSVPETEDDESVLQLESIYVSDQTVSKENSTSGNKIPVTVESNSGTSSNSGTGTETNKEKILVGGYSVKDFGAKGDGKTDDTKAFKSALAAAKENKATIYVPSGTYKLTEGLALGNVTLAGPGVNNFQTEADKMPILLIAQNSTNALTLASGAVSGVQIQYPSNSTSQKSAIYLTGPGNRISNVKISNAYQGIIFDQLSSSSNPGRSNIENVVLEGVRYLGMKVTNTWDVTFVSNVSVTGTDSEYKSKGIGLWFEKNDDVRVSDCVVTNACYGYQFSERNKKPTGEETASTWGTFLRCKASAVKYGMYFTSYFPDKRMQPVMFNDGNIQATDRAVFIEKSGAVLTMTNTVLTSSGASALKIQGGYNVMFNSCAITAQKGNGAEISGGMHVLFHSNTIKASLIGVKVGGYAPSGLVITDNTISASAKVNDTTTAGTVKSISGNK